MKLILLIVTSFFTFYGAAQTANTFAGLVQDEKGNGIPGASLTLFRATDSVKIDQTISNKSGLFVMRSIADGTYYVIASSVNYLDKRSPNFTLREHSIPFDTLHLRLTPSPGILGAVTVTARKPLIVNKLDRTIVNVDAFLNNTGNTLLETLGNSPNVDVDINGNISVKGKSGVLILIEGKQTYLTGSALTNYLNSIPASQVDQIEIMTQPSARYDAAGNSGVINIKLKKNRQMGLQANASIGYMQGFYPRTLNSGSFSYKINKWNFFVNADYNYVKRYTHRRLSRYIQQVRYFQDENDIAKTPDHSLKAGIDYFATKSWVIGLSYGNKYSGQENDITDHSTFTDLQNGGRTISYLDGFNVLNSPWVNNSVALSLSQAVDKKRELAIDFNYENYDFNSRQRSSNYSYDTAHQLIPGSFNPYIQKALLPVIVDIFSVKTDMIFYLGKSRIETGIKTSFTRSKNNSSFYYVENNILKPDNNLTNYYNYHENINAVYFNFHRQLKKWKIQAGLRLEGTHSSGHQRIDLESFSKSYWQLFPTVYIAYSLDDKNSFGLSYGRRIDRPFYSDFNPFLYLIDQYNYKKGNPDLKPYFSNSVQLTYSYIGKLNADIDYGVSNGIIDNMLFQNDSTRILLQMPGNLTKLTTVALNVNYNIDIKKWTSFIISYSLFNNHYRGQSMNVAIDNSVTTNLINFTEQFHFSKGWSAEWSVFYRNKFLLNAASTRGPRKVTSVAFGKTILKNKGSLKLRITDPLYIQQSYGSTFFGNIHTTTNFNEDSRRIGLTFTYRFLKGLKNSQRKLYSPEEKSRVTQN